MSTATLTHARASFPVAGNLLLLTGLTLVAPAGVNAQQPIDSVLAQLRRGTLVRVRTDDGERIEAPIRAVERDSISLRLRHSIMRLGLARIDSLWVGQRKTKTGALIGAVAGYLWSWAFLAYLCEGLSESTAGCQAYGGVTLYAFLGAAVGALLGGGIGSYFCSWDLRYAREPRLQVGWMLRVGEAPQ